MTSFSIFSSCWQGKHTCLVKRSLSLLGRMYQKNNTEYLGKHGFIGWLGRHQVGDSAANTVSLAEMKNERGPKTGGCVLVK